MIQANELRIGNWVKNWDVNEEEGKWHEWTANDYVDPFSVLYEPIPLSPEILAKCGILPFNDSELFKKGSFTCYFQDNILWYFDGSVEVEIKGLHHLQNLYWCLYQTELEIKL